MSDEIVVSTRKGLFRIVRKAALWDIDDVAFLGDNVSLALTDARSGSGYAALDHGHFGVKLHRSSSDGWQEIAAPAYPQKPEGLDEKDMWGRPIPWSTQRIWALATGGADEPGVIWCGTLPGGLFRSADHGDSWTIVNALWEHPKRTQWMGGGADWPGIHSIIVDPRDPRRLWVAVSTGGIWFTEDAGEAGFSVARACGPSMCPPTSHMIRLHKTSIVSRNVRPRLSECGFNIIMAFSSRLTRAGHSGK